MAHPLRKFSAFLKASAAAVLLAFGLGGAAALAQEVPSTAPKPKPTPHSPNYVGPARGSVTNLPLPRFVSLKSNEANARRGPSLSHRIDWVFTLRGYPLEVIAEYGHWRRVRDVEGAVGWLHYSLISGVRTGLVVEDGVALFIRPDLNTRQTALAEKGAILRLHECDISWCKASASGHKGWVLKSSLWGVRSDEILE